MIKINKLNLSFIKSKRRCSKMAAKGPRENITLECTECKRRNYVTSKNKRNNTERLEVVKYCKFCKKRTTHKETK
jgi:large subunit ribosomal protein L33